MLSIFNLAPCYAIEAKVVDVKIGNLKATEEWDHLKLQVQHAKEFIRGSSLVYICAEMGKRIALQLTQRNTISSEGQPSTEAEKVANFTIEVMEAVRDLIEKDSLASQNEINYSSIIELGWLTYSFTRVGNALVQLRKGIPSDYLSEEITTMFTLIDEEIERKVDALAELVQACPGVIPQELKSRLEAIVIRSRTLAGMSTTGLVPLERFQFWRPSFCSVQ